jgi:cell division septation protein DedD
LPTKAIMGLTDTGRRCLVGALFIALLAGNLYAQNVPGQLGAEIQTFEQKLSSGATPAERYNALVRLAKLRQLSGSIAEAAANWLDAAAVNPQDAAALVSGAYCLTAIGEWEKAAAALRPLLATDRTGPVMLQARYLDACLRAWLAGDVSPLVTLAANPEFYAIRPLIYYTLWQTLARNPAITGTDSANSWKSRLLAEFPQSPEARAANPSNEKDSPAVSAVQSPLWQLLPGSTPSAGTTKPPAPAPVAPAPVVSTATPAAPTPAAPAATTAAPSPAVSAVVLQTGLFSKEANARAQSDALRGAGFTALISRKQVNGAEYWAVTVPAGQDQRKTTADLKKAGFDSFPVKQ